MAENGAGLSPSLQARWGDPLEAFRFADMGGGLPTETYECFSVANIRLDATERVNIHPGELSTSRALFSQFKRCEFRGKALVCY
jgi:hypothetical protein